MLSQNSHRMTTERWNIARRIAEKEYENPNGWAPLARAIESALTALRACGVTEGEIEAAKEPRP